MRNTRRLCGGEKSWTFPRVSVLFFLFFLFFLSVFLLLSCLGRFGLVIGKTWCSVIACDA